MPDKFNELLLKQDIIELYNTGITPDYGYLMNGRFEKDMVKTLYPLKTLSGNPISWEASDTEYLFPVVSLEPKQAGSGDPSPENVRPISGYDSVTVNVWGKNLIGNFGEKTTTTAGVTWTIENDKISAQGETGEHFSSTSSFFDITCPVPPASYSISYKITDNNINLICVFLKSDNTVLAYLYNNKSYTLTENNAYVRFYAQVKPNCVVNGTISDIQFEVSSTPTPYEPYQGTTATLTLPETIYGGTVDAVTGVGSKTWEFVEFDGTEAWYTWGVDNMTIGLTGFYLYDEIPAVANSADYLACSHLVFNSSSFGGRIVGFQASLTGEAYWIFTVPNEILSNTESNTAAVESWKAYLAAQAAAGTPVQVAYKLATPEPFQATGNQQLTSLLGYNTIYTNGESIKLNRKARRLEV